MNTFINHQLGAACGFLILVNTGPMRVSLDPSKTDELLISKLMGGIFFGALLFSANDTRPLKNKFSPLAMIAPLAITLGTFAVAQVAKYLGKYQKALTNFDKISDKIREVAFSVASIYCLTIYARHINWSVPKWEQAASGLWLAISALTIVCKMLHAASARVAPQSLKEFYEQKGIKTGNEPLVVDLDTLGLDLTETHRFRMYENPGDESNTNLVTKSLTFRQAAEDTIAKINEHIQKMANLKADIPIAQKRFIYLDITKQPFTEYTSLKTKHPTQPDAWKNWVLRLIDALVEKKYIYKFIEIDPHGDYHFQA